MESENYIKPSSNIIRDVKWVKAELDMLDALYTKMLEDEIEDIEPGLKASDVFPSPDEFFEDPDTYKRSWDNHKSDLLAVFTMKHERSLTEERREKEMRLEKISMTEDEQIEASMKRVAERQERIAQGLPPDYEYPPDFEQDREAYRELFGCLPYRYINSLCILYDIMRNEFPEQLKLLMSTTP